MAFINNTNNISGSSVNGTITLALKQTLLSAGWLLKGSGDGTSNYSNVATTGGTQATDYLTSSAALYAQRNWWRIRSPARFPDGNYREFTFQFIKGGSSSLYDLLYHFRIKYSRCSGDIGFYGGTITGSANTTPTSQTTTDEFIILGSGYSTDTGSVGFHAYDGTLGGNAISDSDWNSSTSFWNVMAETSSPYPFFLHSHTQTTKTPKICVSFFPLDAASYNLADSEPYVFVNLAVGGAEATRKFKSILGIGTVNQSMVDLTLNPAPQAGQHSITGNDTLIPYEFYRLASATAPRGWKGVSSYALSPTTRNLRSNLDTFSVNSTRDKILVGSNSTQFFVFPWDGSIPLF